MNPAEKRGFLGKKFHTAIQYNDIYPTANKQNGKNNQKGKQQKRNG